jgi:glycosyltransferase involved in cell wall biosynthesis
MNQTNKLGTDQHHKSANRVAVVVPTYNEASTIKKVCESLASIRLVDIIVVDDASDDNSLYEIEKLDCVCLTLPYNMGAWRATQAGLRYAYEMGYDKVITFDADGQHLAESISILLECQHSKNVDMVIGACIQRGSFLRHVAWRLFRVLSGVKIQDLTSGLRLYNRKAMEVVNSRYASILEYQDVGVLLLLTQNDINIAEVAVDMKARHSGISRIFHSWGAVAYYMLYTFVLCLSKIFQLKRPIKIDQ